MPPVAYRRAAPRICSAGTHVAVSTDSGLDAEAAARQFDLDSVPLLTERYYFACTEATLADPCLTSTLAYLQGSPFCQTVLEHPGYDASGDRRVAVPAKAVGLP